MEKLLFLLSLSTLLSACSSKKDQADLRPNVVLIMADDLGYGDLSCYGNTNIRTPNLDLLAANGVKFTDFHSNGAVCSPTRAALMTGKYQQRTGVSAVITAKSHRDVGLSLEETTLAEEFKKYGYNCGMFGKWHLGYDKAYNPVLQGFDEFVGFVSGNVDYHAHIDQEGYLDWWKDKEVKNEAGYSTDLITKYGVQYIKKYNPKQTGKPFFLYLPHEAPHGPYQRRVDKVLREVGQAGTKAVNKDSIPAIYQEMVEVMDEGIGQIIQSLKATGQYENTILVFVSDNGANRYGDNGGLKGYKGGPYEGGSRVPAIFSFPNQIEGGTVSQELALSMDLLPTFLDFIDQQPSASQVDGISLKAQLLNQTPLPQRDVFFAYKNRSFIRSGDWKLVRFENADGNRKELYNLADDLQEQQELSSKYPVRVEELLTKLEAWEQRVNAGVQVVAQ